MSHAATKPDVLPVSAPSAADMVFDAEAVRRHVLARIEATPVGTEPFYHCFIEEVFPADFFQALRAKMEGHRSSDEVKDRAQDNPLYKNRRYNLVPDKAEETEVIRYVFHDPEVMRALLSKFYVSAGDDLVSKLRIHTEFEFVYTAAGRFQNIHVDIPPKFLSFVFYLPSQAFAPEIAERNSTILYDKALQPHYKARFQPNAVCVFAPHFYSYHGFSTTVDRDALVMFYVDAKALKDYNAFHRTGADAPPFTGFLERVEARQRQHPLKEIGDDPETLAAERAACLVNAPQGRVMIAKP